MLELAQDSRDMSYSHPGLYTLIYKYLKSGNVNFHDIKHAMTQNENIEQDLYLLAMNSNVDAYTGAPLNPDEICDDPEQCAYTNRGEDYDTRASFLCKKYSSNDPDLCVNIEDQLARFQPINKKISEAERELGQLKQSNAVNTEIDEKIEELWAHETEKKDLLLESKKSFIRLNLAIQCQQHPNKPCVPTQINAVKKQLEDIHDKITAAKKSPVNTETLAALKHNKDKLIHKRERLTTTLEHTKPSLYPYNPVTQMLNQDNGPVIFKHDLQHAVGDFEVIQSELAFDRDLFRKKYPALMTLIESYIYQKNITDQSIRTSIERIADDYTFETTAQKKEEISKLLDLYKQAKSFQQSIINNETFSSYLENNPWEQFYLPNATINNLQKLKANSSRGMVTLSSRYDATINTQYDLTDYPFDTQTFIITIADRHNSSELHKYFGLKHDFKMEFENTKKPIFNKDSFPAGWKLVKHKTEFVDLIDAGNGMEPAAKFTFTLKRNSPRSFFTTFATLYLAYILSLIALSLTNKASFFTAKNALMLGSIFSLMSNINSTQDLLKNHSAGLSLIDTFQIITMSLLLLSIVSMYTCMWLNQNEIVKRARIIRLVSVATSLSVFIISNILLLI